MGEGHNDISGYLYAYNGPGTCESHSYLLPTVFELLREIDWQGGKRLFDLGCGNGVVASLLASKGYDVSGVDPSREGIEVAKKYFPELRLEQGSAYDDLVGKFGQFPVVLSLEVVEHLYYPRRFAKVVYDLLEEDGTAIISTPYHGYLKNLALALLGRMDDHYTALWDHGHIKFWSISTITELMREAGFRKISSYRVGRIAPVAKSMIIVAKK